MNIEEIKRNAPEGATHYDKLGYYLKHIDDGWLIFNSLKKEWSKDTYIFDDFDIESHEIKPL